jgi:RHS repeat-associated protein
MAARTTSAIYANGTFTTGQFPLSVTNALSQTSSTAWSYELGVPLSATDANGVNTSWTYDAFGRRTSEVRPDGTSTVRSWTACPSGCGSLVRYYVGESIFAGVTPVTTRVVLFDQMDRMLGEQSRIRTDLKYRDEWREFDALGRVVKTYFPHYNTDPSPGFSTMAFDLVGRLSSESHPISDTNPTPQVTSYYHEGLTSRIVDPQSKEKSTVVTAAGQLRASRDSDGNYQLFEYDPFENPKRVSDQAGNVLQTSDYNVRGMLTARTDMDMGSWGFSSNALGELTSQTDAKGQPTSFSYDALGRLTSRGEAEGTSTWVWGVAGDNTGSNKYIGNLKSVSGPGYSETYVYDALARISNTTINSDATYQIDYTYNSLGSLDTLTYPTSTSGYRLKLQYTYSYGLLTAISDYNSPVVFWYSNDINARYQTVQETLGNGLVVNRALDAVNARLKSIQTGLGGGTKVQNLAYEWDLVGNLKKRIDLNQSNLTEEFFYDNVYRLGSSQRNGATNLTMAYDAIGNITSKSGIGAYTYDGTKKHQVTSTGNGWSFGYDGNGNMTSGRGATITWTSFNYPASIGNGSDTSSFSYTPDRQYWKQVSNYTSGGAATTIYVGGLLEKVTSGGNTDYKHMIRTDNARIVVSRRSDGQNVSWYALDDHLGSNSVVTTQAGLIQMELSNDAFGARRAPNWQGSPTSSDWLNIAGTTRRGYTDHTMLDNLSLTHMNGRVYDQLLGRFLSADPYITEPGNTQGYNRYSYVLNKPLSFTDPSGFEPNGPPRLPSVPPAPDYSPCWWAGATGGCQPPILPEPDDGGEQLPEIVVCGNCSDRGWSGTHHDLPQSTQYGKEIYRNAGVVCYEAGCLRYDGSSFHTNRD